jgi:hypothetical protein
MSRRLVDGQNPERIIKEVQGNEPKLTEDMINRISQAIRMGMFADSAFALEGLTTQDINRYISNARRNPDSIYGVLFLELKKAMAQSELRDLAVIDKHAQGSEFVYQKDSTGRVQFDEKGKPIILKAGVVPDWKAAAWKLERRHSKKWGQKMTFEDFMGLDITEKETIMNDAQTDKLREEARELAKKVLLDDPDAE